ncbi:ArsJ-associated glyceraldehyde-3-phosphate dehydrogenase [Exilibacterium tricleocarpae]|uniref:Glyceraldehyde-3-phosphate dehydrogenase n=1 Tax=Exilibacterium tricleocarpae TaxID=2591008 RepID=A0A545STI5_9GAMM|nr:ArsJ-associated glyceraldehyde-3-phosphate dehydrogenase [Exilibacterium tricleocarpae]TQV68283.1 ArsJ-associated glyceraldehyde-3-phosphate dehydrogenase [Exilibacterium tricleocarpae]
MTVRIGINGFGRMGRLALRAAWDWPEFTFTHINEVAGDAGTAAHLVNFDSVHGRWHHEARAGDSDLHIGEKRLSFSQHSSIAAVPWAAKGVDLVLECSGRFKTREALIPYLDCGVARVVVSAPAGDEIPTIVMGVNDPIYQPAQHPLVSAASCTTNCLAPVVKVIHESLGIEHGCITTIHSLTNTQSILDHPHRDLRRARAGGLSLIPTSTGSAKAIGAIFPALAGKLNGLAVRVPLANASLTDCVFEVSRATSAPEVNELLAQAAAQTLKGILGVEQRPLVSADYTGDPRSSIVDALSTLVIDGTQVKILAWYDNEIGYVNRMLELARKVAPAAP